MSQYIPDMTERFPEGMNGIDMTDSYFPSKRYGGYEPSDELFTEDEMYAREFEPIEYEDEEE